MRNISILVVVAICVCSSFILQLNAQDIFVGKDGNIRNIDARALVAGRDAFYLATKNVVYRSIDMKDSWEAIFTIPSGSYEINCLALRATVIFVGTQKGLFRSDDRGQSWKNIFKTIIPEKNDVLSVDLPAAGGNTLYIGTAKGIFESNDLGDRWKDISGILKNRPVKSIALHKGAVYAGSDSGIYVKQAESEGWERLIVQGIKEDPQEEAQGSEMPEEYEEAANTISFVVATAKRLYIGIDKKVLYSEDGTRSWKPFTQNGLSGPINDILPSAKSEKLYCATAKGVFEYDTDRGQWRELYKGKDRNFFAIDILFADSEEKTLWAVTDNGIYRFETGHYIGEQFIDVEKNMKTFKIAFDAEPSFKELQRAAMKFAEVEPEKIEKWRSQARLKSLVPKVSVGMDRSQGTTSEIYTSATTKYIVEGPEDISRGVDVSVSWDLSALIWSDDQTNIDVRSRLSTQLRNDILDDLRRAYFERKRLTFELMTNPSADLKLRFEKELRIQELTQAIDDLTGNYLSEHIKKN